MQVNGTLINYYFHCKRQCYLHGNRLNLEDNIRYGTGIERRAIKQRTDYRSRKVKSIDTFGNVTTYNSAREASRVTGVNQGSISKCCNGLRVSAGLYKWSYE